MDKEVLDRAKELLSSGYSYHEVKDILSRKGLMDQDIDAILSTAISKLNTSKKGSHKRTLKVVSVKELFDRLGYGFVTHPFINILFSFTGASYFLIGLINGLRMILSLFLASFLKEFSRIQPLKKAFISRSGILFGFSFLIMSFAIVFKSPLLYSLFLLVGAVGVVGHGEVYTSFLSRNTKREHSPGFLIFLSRYGLLITIVAMLISGYIMDLFPLLGTQVSFELFGSAFQFRLYGYLISFEITALAFIFSGLALSYIKQEKFVKEHTLPSFIPKFFSSLKANSSIFFNSKPVMLLTIASLVSGLVQVLGNSFYGIFIYEHFKTSHFGGFLNVAIIFAVAALFSFVGHWFSKSLKHHLGIAPMLVFGTLLSAMLPLALAFNPGFYVIIAASAFSILGTSILGLAQGFFMRKLLTPGQRNIFFSYIGSILAIPLLILVPIGSYVANIDLVLLFKVILGLLLFVSLPIYLFMVFMYERHEKSF